jgi:hypothetical protein
MLLYTAVVDRCLDAVQLLLRYGANIEIITKVSHTHTLIPSDSVQVTNE